MSIATRLEAINQHLLDDYSVLTLAGADLTNIDKNIVNLKPTWKERLLYFINNGTDVVWDNWDKVTGEGTSLTLNNTLEAKMKIVYKGNTEQNGTPTPDTPIPIQVVSGDNSIEVCGKNLFDKNNINLINNYYVDSTGKIVAGSYNKFNWVILQPNTTYTLSQLKKSPVTIRITLFDTQPEANATGTILGTFATAAGITQTFTTTNNGIYLGWVYCNTNSLGGYTEQEMIDSIQIEYGNQSSTYTPYQSQTYPINLPVENLLNKTNYTLDSYGKLGIDISNLVIGETYTFSTTIPIDTFKISNSYSGYNSVRKQENNKFSTFTFTMARNENIPEGTTQYLFIKLDSSNWATSLSDLSGYNLQVEKGTKANTYTPYGTTPIELCKIGTYQDKIDKSTGKNLLDLSILEQGIYDNTATPSLIYTTDARYRTFKLYLNKGTYTINTNNALYVVRAFSSYDYSTERSLGVSQNISTYASFTTTQDCYVYFAFRKNDGNNWNDSTDKVWLTKGTSDTSYEPYGTSWYLKKEIGKVVLNGTEEGWSSASTSTTGINRFFTSLLSSVIQKPSSASTLGNGICNYFSLETADQTYSKNNGFGIHSNGNIFFYDDLLKEYTMVQFKEWLSTHNTELYYVLATPTYTKITDSTLISQLNALENARSYSDQTNLSQVNDDLPFILDTIALSQLS